METTQAPTMSRTGGEISPNPKHIIAKSTEDSGTTTSEPGTIDAIDSSGNNTQTKDTTFPFIPSTELNGKETKSIGLTPKFRLEGSGEGDSRVSLPGTTSESGQVPLSPNQSASESIGTDTDRGGTPAPIPTNGDNSLGHSSLSRQNSEEMPLSLVSWYSEPGDTNSPLRTCCTGKSKLKSHIHSDTTVFTVGSKIEGSEGKENKTPNSIGMDQDSLSKSNTTNQLSTLKNVRSVKMQDSGQRKGRLDKKGNLDRTEHERSRSVGTRVGDCIGSGVKNDTHDRIECPRCSRKSKSGNATPAVPSRTPKRQILPNKKSIQNLKKPIKSILKNDSRGSSGSEKQSSMDSLGSSTGVSPLLMTRSDSGPRTKFFFKQSDENSHKDDKDYAGLKRIERYATIRVRKPRADSVSTEAIENGRRKLSFENIQAASDVVSVDLMTKSMSYLEKTIPNVISEVTPSLKRQGSLRGRKPSPGWEPCATKTSALRLLKMQENKAKQGNSVERPNSGAHSGSGDSISTNVIPPPPPPVQCPQPPRVSGGGEKKSLSKVFSKLSSALGQTASSSQKRLRQERGIQTEPIIMMKMAENYRAASTQGNRRSPTPISPIPISEDIPEDISPVEEINHLRLAVKRYKAKAIKFQHIYEEAEMEKIALENHLRELEGESKEMINFLQDEKSLLAESLNESEVEIKKLKDEIEDITKECQSRCSSVVRLSEQHKQEALKLHAFLKRAEADSSAHLWVKATQLEEGTVGIREMKQRILKLSETLLKKYKVSQDLLTSATVADGSNAVGIKLLDESDLKGSLLFPLITILSSAFESSTSIQSPKTTDMTKAAELAKTVTNGDIQMSCISENPNDWKNSHGSLENLIQAIKEREEAERAQPFSFSVGGPPDDSLSIEIHELQLALRRLVTVIQSVVIHCDRRVSNVATNILEVLKSSESE